MKTRTTRRRPADRTDTPAFGDDLRARAQRMRDGSVVGDFLARETLRLADLADFFGATNPTDLEDRRTAEEDAQADRHYEMGREDERRQHQADSFELRTFGPLGRPLDPSASRISQ